MPVSSNIYAISMLARQSITKSGASKKNMAAGWSAPVYPSKINSIDLESSNRLWKFSKHGVIGSSMIETF